MKSRYRYMPPVPGSAYHGWVLVSEWNWWCKLFGVHYFLPCGTDSARASNE